MAEITQIATVQNTVPATSDDILALRTRIDVLLFNIMMGNGTYGGAEYQENGEVGFRIDTGMQVQNLLKWREQLTEDLKSPELLGEIMYTISRLEGTHCVSNPSCGCS